MFFKNGYKAVIVAFLVCLVAIPLNAQTRVYSNIFSQDSKTFLGIQMEDVTADKLAQYKLNHERGVIVNSVVKGSPAEAANLQKDDVILEFAGTQVWSSVQMTRLVEETPPGRKVDLAVSRDGKRINLTAQIKARDERDSSDRAFNEMFPQDLFGANGRGFQFKNGIPAPQSANKPKLGVALQSLTDQLAEYFGVEGKKGVLISSVTPNSPSSGKLNPGDVIISADGKSIEEPDDLAQFVRDKSGAINLKVVRDKKEITVTVTLPEEGRRDNKGFKL